MPACTGTNFGPNVNGDGLAGSAPIVVTVSKSTGGTPGTCGSLTMPTLHTQLRCSLPAGVGINQTVRARVAAAVAFASS